MRNVVTSSQWGVVAAVIDPSLAESGVALTVPGGKDGQTLHALTCSVFGGASPFRVIVFSGLIPASVADLTAWDMANSVPLNSIGALVGVTPLWEALVPANGVLEIRFGDGSGIGPASLDTTPLSVLAVCMADGNTAKSYVSLSAFATAGSASAAQSQSFSARSVSRASLGY